MSMKTVIADFNATTENGYIRLELPCSLEDVDRFNLKPGDCAWLMDSDQIVMALLAIDSKYGLVGIPDWGWAGKVGSKLTNIEDHENLP